MHFHTQDILVYHVWDAKQYALAEFLNRMIDCSVLTELFVFWENIVKVGRRSVFLHKLNERVKAVVIPLNF